MVGNAVVGDGVTGAGVVTPLALVGDDVGKGKLMSPAPLLFFNPCKKNRKRSRSISSSASRCPPRLGDFRRPRASTVPTQRLLQQTKAAAVVMDTRFLIVRRLSLFVREGVVASFSSFPIGW